MKTSAITLLILSLLLVCSSPGFADIIPDGHHYVQRCVKIINLNQFPDLVLVAYVIWPPGKTDFSYIIQAGECLNGGYKFSKFRIYATTPERAKALGITDLETRRRNLSRGEEVKQQMPPEDLTLLSDQINPHAGVVADQDPLVYEEVEYAITKMTDGSLSL